MPRKTKNIEGKHTNNKKVCLFPWSIWFFFSVDLNEESNKSKAEKRVNVSHVHIVVKGNFDSEYPQLTSRLNVHTFNKTHTPYKA